MHKSIFTLTINSSFQGIVQHMQSCQFARTNAANDVFRHMYTRMRLTPAPIMKASPGALNGSNAVQSGMHVSTDAVDKSHHMM